MEETSRHLIVNSVGVKELKRHPFLPPFFLPFFWGLMVSWPGFFWQTNFIFDTLNFYSDMTSGCPWLCVTIVMEMVVVVQSLSCVRLFVTPGTVACQSPLSMGFPWQEYWSGLPFPSTGDLPNPGIEPASPMSPALSGGFFTLSYGNI